MIYDHFYYVPSSFFSLPAILWINERVSRPVLFRSYKRNTLASIVETKRQMLALLLFLLLFLTLMFSPSSLLFKLYVQSLCLLILASNESSGFLPFLGLEGSRSKRLLNMGWIDSVKKFTVFNLQALMQAN